MIAQSHCTQWWRGRRKSYRIAAVMSVDDGASEIVDREHKLSYFAVWAKDLVRMENPAAAHLQGS
jgi:hypothetical protein